ncbi:hypothetical protein FSARC_7969 [Fusarium sarcochroum]|uniref:PD-(D/E)XK nuclease-like domain-containing protein n=1 Tax=Fusarium sarcochroum TaxID=1208366 RepID=A0A8H4X6S4_9HYPO|nr:hypothetical protein FSARC_7969 [Fusarium sarcochroum]
MDSEIIEIWVDEVNSCYPSKYDHITPIFSDFLPTYAQEEDHYHNMSSPPKRQRTEDSFNYREAVDQNQDLQTTPRPDRAQQIPLRSVDNRHASDPPSLDTSSSTDSSSAYMAALALKSSRPVFPIPTTRQYAQTESSATRSRSSSPSKHYQKTASLLNLERPVRFVKVDSLKKSLGREIHTLLQELAAASNCEGIFPAALRTCPDFDDEDIRPFMWQPANPSSEPGQENDPEAHNEYAHLQDFKNRSLDSSNRGRSEAAWNCRVHDPLLYHLTSTLPFIDVEPITSARIETSFRPPLQNPSGRGNASGDVFETSPTKTIPAASSVHKMVDFALVLQPDEELQCLVDQFLSTQPMGYNTINQTKYEPLRSRPAPICIETKTVSGTLESANVQLGVWVAAWHERIRSIMMSKSISEKIITVPVVQVIDDVWTVLFAVDTGSEIQLLHRNLRIGDTSTISGVYQLRAAIAALSKWMKNVFEPWIKDLLRRVTTP